MILSWKIDLFGHNTLSYNFALYKHGHALRSASDVIKTPHLCLAAVLKEKYLIG